ncbi:MaoC family dehydratase [Nocardioides yefusunii]|uniref:MaoC family dehydratase n=1 Tax=Nocardioides yefusunii TaxID=2500546 RepID=A0ABW1QU73_9ACTN|nr:MaoC family dehydratase [Nocardioides yefusunii]
MGGGPVVLASVADVEAVVGRELGPGEWTEITQQRIDTFADATDDHQWIHVDPVRAAVGPYGTTIAHGHLTSSLLPSLLRTVYRFEGYRMSVNYGSDTIRFPAPVPVGARIRARAVVAAVETGPKGTQVLVRSTVEVEGSERPALVATTRSLVVF